MSRVFLLLGVCLAAAALLIVVTPKETRSRAGEMLLDSKPTLAPTPAPTQTTAERKAREAEERREIAALEKKRSEDGPKARALLAQLMERGYLERGMDVHVTATGKGKKQLRIEWILAGRPFSYQQGNDRELVETLRAAGFESLYILDGQHFGEVWDLK